MSEDFENEVKTLLPRIEGRAYSLILNSKKKC